jgi:DNA-binding response OmpR family regulator
VSPDHILVVDDDDGIREMLLSTLTFAGFRVSAAASAESALQMIGDQYPDAVVLDVMMPGLDGFDFVQLLRHRGDSLPVLFLTARDAVDDRVRGLRLGADDWLSKPCHPEELIARVEAVVRRRRRSDARTERGPVAAGELEIRSDRFQAFVDGRSVDLTRREFELIELLAGSEGRVLEREEIYQRVWGYAMARGDRSVDVFVRKLRQKLEKASPGWRYIHTHFGVGYRFSPEPAVGEGTVPEPVVPAVQAGERGDAPAESPEHATLS